MFNFLKQTSQNLQPESPVDKTGILVRDDNERPKLKTFIPTRKNVRHNRFTIIEIEYD